jgi:hypothetical protein
MLISRRFRGTDEVDYFGCPTIWELERVGLCCGVSHELKCANNFQTTVECSTFDESLFCSRTFDAMRRSGGDNQRSGKQ